ncbi:MAG: glutaredoxin domain-containing protein [Elusimicrobiota bacterium]|nr:glutaredoxin domain-containing protein [Elusimicrobiota bacterium]
MNNAHKSCAPRVKPAARVELYATSWCPACRAAREYFGDKGVAFEEYDVEKDPQAGQRFLALGGNGVPLVVIDGTPVKGFAPKAFDALLAGR